MFNLYINVLVFIAKLSARIIIRVQPPKLVHAILYKLYMAIETKINNMHQQAMHTYFEGADEQ